MVDISRRLHSLRNVRAVAVVIFTLLIGIFLAEQTELIHLRSVTSWPSIQRPHQSVHHTPVGVQEHVKVEGRILVTGGGGMLGKQVISRLLSSGNSITVLDKVFFQDELDAIHAAYPGADLEVIYGDIRDDEVLQKALSRDIIGVIHLAAVSRVEWCLENERDCQDVNVRGTEKVLEAFNGAWFIQASSREVYGNAEAFPVTEDAPLKPANAYGLSKAMAEEAIQKMMNSKRGGEPSLNVILLRFSNIYGSPQDHRERLIPAIFTNALASRTIQIIGGHQDLAFVHIHDVVDAVMLAIKKLESKRHQQISEVQAFNVGLEGSTKAMDLIKKILAITNSSSPIQLIPGDARYPDKFIGSGSKATTLLGYTAKVDMNEGIRRLAIDYLAETVDYLDDKVDKECKDKSYSISDLEKLDGCTGTLALNIDDQPMYAKYVENEDQKLELEWRDDDEPQIWTFDIKSHGKEAIFKMSQDLNGKNLRLSILQEGHILNGLTEFRASVDPKTGYVSLRSMAGELLDPVPSSAKSPYLFRVTPYCCAGKPTPWPFFKEDPLASAINDQRLETRRDFNATQQGTLCRRFKQARQYALERLERLEALPASADLPESPLPTGRPFDWRQRNRDVCTNLCDHPTTCVDTGNCACSQAACVSRQRFPFSSFANLPDLSFPPPAIDWDQINSHNPDILIDQVAASSWLNVLRPSARRYLSRQHGFEPINVTRLPDDVQAHRDSEPDHYDRLQTEYHGCFSADSTMERGAKLISKEYTPESLVFLPYYSYTLRFPSIEDWVANALEKHLPPEFDMTNMIIPFTFDWGRCNTVLHNLFKVRDWSTPPPPINYASSWQPMGDLNSGCYFMDQDVVIPSRTCLQDKLRDRFGDMSQVRPSRKRSILTTFKGSFNGAGLSVRHKIMCERDASHVKPKLIGGDKLQVFWNRMKTGEDYLETIGDTIFCPVPRGTTGWATRTIDVVYAGCIPVLIGDQTQHAFWSVLDWSKFSVQILDHEVDHLEEILLGYTWEQVSRLQTNLMLIRDAFLYPTEGDMDGNIREKGPFFYAMHETALLRRTMFPT